MGKKCSRGIGVSEFDLLPVREKFKTWNVQCELCTINRRVRQPRKRRVTNQGEHRAGCQCLQAFADPSVCDGSSCGDGSGACGRWFHASYQNTVGARALVQKFKTERSNLILLPRPCVKEAADLISRETRAHVYLGEVIEACCFPGSAGASPVALSANMCEKGVRTQP